MSAPKYTLYDYLPSGNGYKVRLTAKRLDIPYRLVPMDIKHGARSFGSGFVSSSTTWSRMSARCASG